MENQKFWLMAMGSTPTLHTQYSAVAVSKMPKGQGYDAPLQGFKCFFSGLPGPALVGLAPAQATIFRAFSPKAMESGGYTSAAWFEGSKTMKASEFPDSVAAIHRPVIHAGAGECPGVSRFAGVAAPGDGRTPTLHFRH